MVVYKYRNYVSSDKEKLEGKIFDLLCEDNKSIAVVESLVEDEEVEEFNCSCKGIFDMLKQGYIFIESAREV